METRPLSKDKRWRLVEIIRKRQNNFSLGWKRRNKGHDSAGVKT